MWGDSQVYVCATVSRVTVWPCGIAGHVRRTGDDLLCLWRVGNSTALAICSAGLGRLSNYVNSYSTCSATCWNITIVSSLAEQLIKFLWPQQYVDPEHARKRLDTVMSNLGWSLAAPGQDQAIIKKCEGYGYRCVAPVEVYSGGERGIDRLRAMAKFTQRIWAEPPAYRGLGERPPDVAGPRIFCLGDDIRIALDLDGAGHLLLLDKGPEGTIYCLCPSWFAPVTCIRPGRAYLPQANASWGAFRLTGKPGREYLLAITTEDALAVVLSSFAL